MQSAMSALLPIATAKADMPQMVMSALPPKADMCGAMNEGCRLWAKSGHSGVKFSAIDHLASASIRQTKLSKIFNNAINTWHVRFGPVPVKYC